MRARTSIRLRHTTAAARALVLATLAAWPLSGGAQILNDPTRPPAAALSAAPESDGRSGTSSLHIVMISPAERVAIIGGKRVKEGDKYGDARVVRITDSQVELISASGNETLRLYPNVEMKSAETPAAVAAPKTARKPNAKPNNVRGKQP